MSRVNYTEEQINAYLELAQEVGLTRAKRDLGYPGSWATGQRWASMRGLSVDVDPLMQKAAATREWYKDEEKVLVAQEGLQRVLEQLQEDTLTPKDLKELASATKTFVDVISVVQGKPTHISENNTGDDVFKKMLDEFNVSQRDLQPEEER